MFKNFYTNKRVLVTGHTGFKGSWLCIWLRELGAEVIGYSLEPPSRPSHFEASRLAGRVTHVHGDIRDRDHLLEVFQGERPDLVFHLAAQSLVRLSYQEPLDTFHTNAVGTANVLEAVRLTPAVKAVINVTSDKCYENREWVWGYRESDPLGGHDPYSASKACAELVFAAYLRSFLGEMGKGAASVRAGNVIGGGDWGRDRLLPDCVRALSAGETIRIRMAKAVRPWQHVLEPLSGYLWLGALLWDFPRRYSGAWNFGPDPGEERTVADVVEKAVELWGSGAWQEEETGQPYHEAGTLRLSCDKARTLLGWRDILSSQECLERTIRWYRTFYRPPVAPDMYETCREEIHAYAERARAEGLAWAV
ncbi:MAG: CDP-glucose 4,6-dehydratase [Thermodesulfobacteriota bacterium]